MHDTVKIWAVIKTAKTVRVGSLVYNAGLKHKLSRSRDPVLKQPMFDWKVVFKYKELWNVKIEVRNINMINNYNTWGIERVPVILNLLGWERIIEILKDDEQ